MEERKNNKTGLIVIIVVLILIILGLIGYILYKDVLKKENNKVTTTTTTTLLTKENDDEKDESNNEIVKLQFKDEENKSLYKIMNINVETLLEYVKNDKTVDFDITDIVVNNTNHKISIKNYSNNYNCEKGKDKVVYFDNKKIFEPYAEGCYLIGIEKIIVYKEKYIIIKFFQENGGWIEIFDETGKEIKTDNNISIYSIEEIKENSIKILGWDDTNEELNCKNNEYELMIENNDVKISLIKKGIEDYCS